MKNKKHTLVGYLYPFLNSLLFGVAGYFLSGNDVMTGMICFFISFSVFDHEKQAQIIKQKDDRIEYLGLVHERMRAFFKSERPGEQSVILNQVKELLND